MEHGPTSRELNEGEDETPIERIKKKASELKFSLQFRSNFKNNFILVSILSK